MRELRPDQVGLKQELREAIATGERRFVVQAPTGWGKTIVAADITESARERKKRLLFTVPAKILVDQTYEKFYEQGLRDIGVIQADHHLTDWSKPIQIASVQTLISRGLPDADVVLIDEIHKWFEFYGKWLCDPAWQQKPIMGLSATPWRKGLKNYFNKLIRASTTEELIEQGLLSDFKVFAPDHPDLSGVAVKAGEYHEGQLSATMQHDSGLTANIVETWLKQGRGRPTFCFAVDRAHAKLLEKQFTDAGVRTAYQDQHTKDHERKAIKRCFHDGTYEVVVSVGTMIVGTDWDVRCISDAQPTLSEMRHVQKIGRGLRTAEGKDCCIAEGSLVLTDHGMIPIENVTIEMRVWDGCEWVEHEGTVYQGERSTIEYDGLIATPEHEVFTNEGKQTFAECASRQGRIIVTERDGEAVRIGENNIATSTQKHKPGRISEAYGQGGMRDLLSLFLDLVRQPRAWTIEGVPQLQSAASRAEMVGSAHECSKGSLLQSTLSAFFRLWWPWNQIQFCIAIGGGDMGSREPWARSQQASGSHRQRGPLRARESSAVNRGAEYVAHPEKYSHAEAARVSIEASGSEVCRRNAQTDDVQRTIGRRNNRSMDDEVLQAKRRVWDILNAGPFHRFTVSGKLVSNCVILDHASNHNGRPTSLGFVTDIDVQHDHLYGGDAKTTSVSDNIRLPKECPQCGYLKAPGKAVCPVCACKTEAHSRIEPTQGELKEIARKRKESISKLDVVPQVFYAELLAYQRQHGHKPGWVYYKFIDKYKRKPTKAEQAVAPATVISISTENWIKGQNIRRAKSRYRANVDSSTQAVRDFNDRLDGLQREPTPKGFVQGTLMTQRDFEDF
jgi:superfamily II DNA or RNA helicase